jgi:hypothetical protein
MTDAAKIDIPARTWVVWAVAINLLIAFTRILTLRVSPLDLLPDEAQYWSWSGHPAFGYFSKPPMIAWLIRFTTSVAGDSEWGVRLAAPLLHAATGAIVCFIGAALFNARVGFWSGLSYATLPGVSFSALVISTDAPLLFFWALALLAFTKIWLKPSLAWGVVLGVAFGLGFLSKYAMVYFMLGGVCFALISGRGAFKGRSRSLGLAGLLATVLIAPNLLWNQRHGWATIGHTAANANWGSAGSAHFLEALQFAGAQFGVFGPILLTAFIWRIAAWRLDPPGPPERLLIAFAIPILVLMIVQSGISRAHANWAAVAYVAATVLVAGWLDRIGRLATAGVSLALHVLAFAAFTLIFAGSVAVILPKTVDIFHQMRGWHGLAELVTQRVGSMPAGISVAADDREVMAELDYYTKGRSFPLVMAVGSGPAGNQYELDDAVDRRTGARALLISRWPDRRDILDRFSGKALLEEWTMSAGQGRFRHYYVFDVSGYEGG